MATGLNAQAAGDRQSPHSYEAEQATLGSVLIKPAAIGDVAEVLSVDDFFFPAHREVFESMLGLVANGEPIDVVPLYEDLRRRGKLSMLDGQESYLFTLTGAVGTAENVGHYSGIVKERSIARRLIAKCLETASRAYALEDVGDLLTDHMADVGRIESGGDRDDDPVRMGDEIEHVLDVVEKQAANPEQFFVRTGVSAYNRKIGGNRRGHLIVVAALPGDGKCLKVGTLVMRADGTSVAVEDVIAGDDLMGPDSKPRRVLETTRGTGPLFKITPTKGEPWVCNAPHVMTVVHSKTGVVSDVPLDRFLRLPKSTQANSKLFRVPIELPPAALPVDPYFLGVILGDGHVDNGSVSICKPDREIAAECALQAAKWGLIYWASELGTSTDTHHMVIRRGPGGGRGKKNPLHTALAEIGANVKCDAKQVPESYFKSSRGQRLELLAGLIDTDGSLNRSSFDWISASEQLANDVVRLARSVGMAAYMTPCRKGCQTGAVGTYYRVGISGATHEIPTRIPRKKAPVRRQIKDALRTGFTVEPVGDGDFAGFELTGDGRFLLADFTVTHNTSWMFDVALWSSEKQGVPNLIFSMEMPRQELSERGLGIFSLVETRKIHRGALALEDWKQLRPAANRIKPLPLFVADKRLTWEQIESKSHRWAAKVRRDLPPAPDGLPALLNISIDYLQIAKRSRHKGQSDESVIAEFTSACKGLAKDLACPVTLLSQLTKQAHEKDFDGTRKKPEKKDLKGSGAIEADADVIVMPFHEAEMPDDLRTGHKLMRSMLIVEKCRGGATGEIPCVYNKSIMSFQDDTSMGGLDAAEARSPYAD